MIKPKHSFLTKTISKHHKKQLNAEQNDPFKTRRSYFKLTKNNPHLTTIIKDLQKNVKQLKNYHESLQKIKTIKLQKSSSLNDQNKFRCSTKVKPKDCSLPKNNRIFKRISQINRNKQNSSQNHKYPVIESTLSKNFIQNGSTMLSIHNANVDQVKKAYQCTYGKQNTNIVDLYNFFKKNIQKSSRFNGASIQISTLPHVQYSQDLIRSRQIINNRKSNQYLNVIIEDKQQKQFQVQISNQRSNQVQSQSQSINLYKIEAKRNPTMEEIFKNGCPDLANVYDFVKKRRVSLKNYMNFNKNKENKPQLANLIPLSHNVYAGFQQNKDISHSSIISQQKNIQHLKQHQQIQVNLNSLKSPNIEQSRSKNKKQMSQEPQLSQQKYFPTKSSKKSSIKKSKHKQHIDLDQNISSAQIKQFCQISNQKLDNKNQDNLFSNNSYNKLQFGQQFEDKKQQKFKKSKYYVQPVPIKKQNSLDGCSISVKSSSRIIQLDFIPLDL